MRTLKKAFYLAAAGTVVTAIVKAFILAEGFATALKGNM